MAEFKIINRVTGKEDKVKIDKDIIIIGRLESADLCLKGHAVSRQHAEISYHHQNYYITDLKSGNGTFLNGEKIKSNEKHPLKSSDVIRIEEYEIRPILTTLPEKSLEEERTDSGIIEIKMIKKVLSAVLPEEHPSVELIGGTQEQNRIYFTPEMEELAIGRDAECHLSIDSSVISRKHAILKRKWGSIVVIDLESKNGTYIRGEKIEEKMLKDGDIITLGTINVLFRNPQEINLEALNEEFEKEKKELEDKVASKAAQITAEKESDSDNQSEKNPENKEEPIQPESDNKAHVFSDGIEASSQTQTKSLINMDFLKGFLKDFSKIELALMGAGFFVLICALFLLFSILV